MDKYAQRLQQLLDEHQFVPVRTRKHVVYRNPEGRVFVQPSTPSDVRGIRNALSDLRRSISATVVEPEVEAESAPEPAPVKEIRERNIGLTPERWAKRYGQRQQLVVTAQPSPSKRVELISMYQVGSVLRRAFGIIVDPIKPDPKEYYDAMQKLHDLTKWENLSELQLARVERRVRAHCHHLDQTISPAVRILQNVVRKVRRHEHVTFNETRTELVKSFMKIFEGDPLLTTDSQDEREKYCRFLAKQFLGEKKLIAGVCYGTEVRWRGDQLEFRTISSIKEGEEVKSQ
jgi:hypothetical protein